MVARQALGCIFGQLGAEPGLALARFPAVAHKVTLDGETLALTKREHALLLFLARNQGRVLTHRQILTAVWGHAHTEDVAYLRVYIGQLRRKLGAEFAALITTEPGVGYRLQEGE